MKKFVLFAQRNCSEDILVYANRSAKITNIHFLFLRKSLNFLQISYKSTNDLSVTLNNRLNTFVYKDDIEAQIEFDVQQITVKSIYPKLNKNVSRLIKNSKNSLILFNRYLLFLHFIYYLCMLAFSAH